MIEELPPAEKQYENASVDELKRRLWVAEATLAAVQVREAQATYVLDRIIELFRVIEEESIRRGHGF